MHDIEKPLITRLRSVKRPNDVEYVSLENIFREITTSPTLARKTEFIRKLLSEGQKPKAKIEKASLPAAIFSGRFLTAKNSGLESYSGLLVLDFDNLSSSEAEELKQKLQSDPHTALVFISPSGGGVKWVVGVNANCAQSYRQAWKEATAYAEQHYRVPPDPSGCDVSRKCFLPYDPTCTFGLFQELFGGNDLGRNCDTGIQGYMGSKGDSDSPPLPPSQSPLKKKGKPWVISSSNRHLVKQVKMLVPPLPRSNHPSLFRLARLCRTIERNNGLPQLGLPLGDQKTIFALWFKMCRRENLRGTEAEYWNEFREAFNDATVAITDAPWREAWQESQTALYPDVAFDLFPFGGSGAYRRLVSMAAIQSGITGGKIILPCSQIAELAKIEGIADLDHPNKVRRAIKAMGKLLNLVEKGGAASRKANLYEYTGSTD